MGRVVALLLVPVEGDPLGLLVGDACGGVPPQAYRSTAKKTAGQWFPLLSTSNMGGKRRALVLAWGGEPLPSGLDHYHRKAGGYHWSGVEYPADQVSMILKAWGAQIKALGFGTLVGIDAKGREVAS